jgi:hypothetical protein
LTPLTQESGFSSDEDDIPLWKLAEKHINPVKMKMALNFSKEKIIENSQTPFYEKGKKILAKKGEEFDWKDYPFFEKLSKKEQKEFISNIEWEEGSIWTIKEILREVKASESETGEEGYIVSWKNWPSWDVSFVTKDQIDPKSEHVYIFKYKQAKLQKLPLPKRPLFMRDRQFDSSESSSIEGNLSPEENLFFNIIKDIPENECVYKSLCCYFQKPLHGDVDTFHEKQKLHNTLKQVIIRFLYVSYFQIYFNCKYLFSI